MLTLEQTAAALGKTESGVVAMVLNGTLPVLDFEVRDGLVRFDFAAAVVRAEQNHKPLTAADVARLTASGR